MLKKLMIGAAALCATAPMAVSGASAQEFGASVSVDYVSKYVFRGFQLAEGAIQPGVELSYGGLYGGVWASYPSDDDYSDETDYYIGYGFDLTDSVAGDVGVTHYAYPGGGDTTEAYAGLSFGGALAPSVYAYYDFDLEAFTLEGSAGYSWPLGDTTSFDVGAALGAVTADGGDYQYGSAGVALTQAFSDNFSGYIGANAAFNSEDGAFIDDDVYSESAGAWFGVGISFSQ